MVQTFASENKNAELMNIPKLIEEKACIMALTKDIVQMQNRWKNYDLVNCISYFKCSTCNTWHYKAECGVSCAHWHLLQLTQEEKEDFKHNAKTASINLLDHLQDLIPGQAARGKVALVTYQNGINHTYDNHFAKMGDWIKSHLHEGVLCVGLYNKSVTPITDLIRMQCTRMGIKSETVRCTRKMFTSIAKRLSLTWSQPLWLHIAHSEGGLNTHETLAKLPFETTNFCKNHLIVHTYGAVQPVHKSFAKEVINTYSKEDIAYKKFGVDFVKNNEYEINLVDCLEKPTFFVPGDHAFLGQTYQAAFANNINSLRSISGIYNANR